MVDIENWRKEDLEEFYRVNYSPQNATVVIVGDVDPEKVFELVEAKMGSIPRGPDRRPIHTLEPPQSGERRVTLVHPSANLGQVKLAWPIPETSHPDFAVLEVLEDILLAGESSRLHRLLVEEERVVLQVGGGWQDHQFQTSLFTVEAKLREGKSADQVLPLIEAQLAELLAKGPEQRELQKVKNGIEAAFLRRLRTIDEVASVIAETETFFGGWRNLGKRLEAIQKVQPEDIQRVLREYFVTTHRTTAILEVKS
jgi:zinc protease